PGTQNFNTCLNYTHQTLRFHNYPSTNENKVIRSYRGLIEKFQLFGNLTKAEHLQVLLDAALELQVSRFKNKYLIADILSLLSILSLSPLRERYEPPRIPEKPLDPRNIWEAILDEEPTVGDHWQVEDLSNDELDSDAFDDEEGSATEDDEGTIVVDSGLQTHPVEPDAIVKINREPGQVNQALIDLERRQYWSASKTSRVDNKKAKFDPDNPLTLAPAISAHQSTTSFFGAPLTTTKYVRELDYIRESLFVLHGLPVELFTLDEKYGYQPKMSCGVRHITVETLKTILDKFAVWGTMVLQLKKLCDSVLTPSAKHLPATLEAFAHELSYILRDHDKWIAEMEQFYQPGPVPTDKQEKAVASLIDLEQRTARHMKRLEHVAYLLKSKLKPEENDAFSLTLLETLYDNVINQQGACDADKFCLAIKLFMKTFKPFFDVAGNWYLTGLIYDNRNEFLIKLLPKFLDRLSEQLLTIGKALALIRELDPDRMADLLIELQGETHFYEKIAEELRNSLGLELALPRPTPNNATENAVKAAAVVTEDLPNVFDESCTLADNARTVEETRPRLIPIPSQFQFPELFGMKLKHNIFDDLVQNIPNFPHVTLLTRRTKMEQPNILDFDEIGINHLWKPFTECLFTAYKNVLDPLARHVGRITSDLLLTRCDLIRHLRTLRNIMLMQSGIVMGSFCDAVAEAITARTFGRIPNQLQTLYAVSVSSIGNSKATSFWVGESDLVCFTLKDVPSETKDILSALDNIHVSYDVPWPLNAVITQSSIELYNRVLVFLIKLSWAKRRLETWNEQSRKGSLSKLESARLRIQLKHTMISYCAGLHQFAMIFVILPDVVAFEENVVNANGLDEMARLHEDFISQISDTLLLNEKAASIAKAIQASLSTCLRFVDICAAHEEKQGQLGSSSPASHTAAVGRRPGRVPVGRMGLSEPEFELETLFAKDLSAIRVEFETSRRFVVDSARALAAHGMPKLDSLALLVS
ncbi:Gamma-tubulin complex component 5, partial [Chytridiales sp. JEL 0842]